MSMLSRLRALAASEEGAIRPDGRLNLSAGPLVHQNLINGEWSSMGCLETFELPCPLSGNTIGIVPRSNDVEIGQALNALRSAIGGRDGGTRPLFSIDQWAQVFRTAATILQQDADLVIALVRTQFPVTLREATGELDLLVYLLNALSAGMIREIEKGTTTPGMRLHEFELTMHRPIGVTAQVSPWNFPLEIAGAQLICSLACGNVMLVKQSERAPGPIEVLIEILIEAGMPPEFVALVHGIGRDFTMLGQDNRVQRGIFTGSSATFERFFGHQWSAEVSGNNGKVFDPLDFFPGVDRETLLTTQASLTWRDLHERQNQKCSHAALLGLHRSWKEAGFLNKLDAAGAGRTLENLGYSPVLTYNTGLLSERVQFFLGVEGATLVYGGNPLPNDYRRPDGDLADLFDYGYFEPTLIELPFAALQDPEVQERIAEECFGPVNVGIVWETDAERDEILMFLASLEQRLTFGYVTTSVERTMDALRIVSCGTAYSGPFARTTGSPTWFNFGPATGSPADGLIAGPVDSIRQQWTKQVGLQYQPATTPDQL